AESPLITAAGTMPTLTPPVTATGLRVARFIAAPPWAGRLDLGRDRGLTMPFVVDLEREAQQCTQSPALALVPGQMVMNYPDRRQDRTLIYHEYAHPERH